MTDIVSHSSDVRIHTGKEYGPENNHILTTNYIHKEFLVFDYTWSRLKVI